MQGRMKMPRPLLQLECTSRRMTTNIIIRHPPTHWGLGDAIQAQIYGWSPSKDLLSSIERKKKLTWFLRDIPSPARRNTKHVALIQVLWQRRFLNSIASQQTGLDSGAYAHNLVFAV